VYDQARAQIRTFEVNTLTHIQLLQDGANVKVSFDRQHKTVEKGLYFLGIACYAEQKTNTMHAVALLFQDCFCFAHT
jgi:hypothetical protein